MAGSQWFSPVPSINKTDRHDITNIVESGAKHYKTNQPANYILANKKLPTVAINNTELQSEMPFLTHLGQKLCNR